MLFLKPSKKKKMLFLNLEFILLFSLLKMKLHD